MAATKPLSFLIAAAFVAAVSGCDMARPIASPDGGPPASGGTGGAGGVAASCTGCHGDGSRSDRDPLIAAAPPLSVNGTDGGPHLAHLRGGAVRGAIACSACHEVPTSSRHMDGQIAVRFDALAGGTTARWDGATCAVYCHGATLGAGGKATAPAWDSAGTVACDSCHGFPPTSHAASSTRCATCHPGTVKADGTIDLALGNHINGRPDVNSVHPDTWANPAEHGLAASSDLASCRSCHGATLDGGTTGVSCATCHERDGFVNWQSNCTFCHGARQTTSDVAKAAPPQGSQNETATTTRAVGAHQKHLAGGSIGKAVACTDCHVTLPTDLGHVDGTAQVEFGGGAKRGGATPTWNGTTCANYCHGQTLAAGGSKTTPLWTGTSAEAACGTCHRAPPPAPHTTSTACGSCHTGYTATTVNLATHIDGKLDVAAQSCTSCHGDASRASNQAAPPVGTRGETATTTRAVGAHQKHLAGGSIGKPVACAECHAVPTSTSHSNGTVNLTWGALASASGATPSFSGTSLTCANYCHGQTLAAGGSKTTPLWTGTSAEAACGTCHRSPPPAPHTTSTACGSCHPGYTATTVNLATHIDGHLDVAAQSCTSCHGKAGQTATAASPLNAAPPVDASGASTGIRVGAHQKHLLGGTFSNALSCQTCHASVGSYATTHADGTRQVGFTGAASTNLRKGTWNAGTGTAAGTCSSTWCHGAVISRAGGTSGGTATVPSWTGSISACTSCHAVSGSSLPNRHSTHSSRSCGDCHPSYTSSAVNKALHVNGVKDVGNRVTSWNGSTCTNSCHGNETW
jgi:predicted CxxxxCH...CXXCH cytochrome family protein